MQIEDGSLGDAAARLAKAKERLQQALREGASDEEIARLMDELRQATRDYMEQMARDAQRNGEMQQAEIPPDQTMTQDQIQELMDRIQELSEQGRKAEAEALLEMLQQMLDNMQMMMGQSQGGPGENGQGQQSMQGLADALREQQGLADDSFQQLQREFQRGRSGQPGEGEGEGDEEGQAQGGGQGDESLAERQEALRRLTEELQRGLPGAAGEAAREALREAERNMGEAREGLEQGDTAGALDRQAEAIDNLREGMRQMGEDLRQAEGTGEGEQGQVDGASTAENGRDPLGPAERPAAAASAATRAWCPRPTARRGRARFSTRSAGVRASRCGRSWSSTTCGGCSTFSDRGLALRVRPGVGAERGEVLLQPVAERSTVSA